MNGETSVPTDLTTRLTEAAVAAIADVGPGIEAAEPRLRLLTVEFKRPKQEG